MTMPHLIDFTLPILLIELAGALYIAGYAIAAVVVLVRSRDATRARLLIADGAITGLSIKLAATLLKTIELHTWTQILMFASILILRTLLKRVFNWEIDRLQRGSVSTRTIAWHNPFPIRLGPRKS